MQTYLSSDAIWRNHGVALTKSSLASFKSIRTMRSNTSNRLFLLPAKVANSLCNCISVQETTAIDQQTPRCVRSKNVGRNLRELRTRRRNDYHVALADAFFRGQPKFDGTAQHSPGFFHYRGTRVVYRHWKAAPYKGMRQLQPVSLVSLSVSRGMN